MSYSGPNPVVVSIWADWASVWKATESVVESMQAEFTGRCEFVYVEARDKTILSRFGAEIVPTVLVLHQGKEVARFANLLDGTELREVLEPLASADSTHL